MHMSVFLSLLCVTCVNGWWYSEECYENIGCFSNSPPFNNVYPNLPESPSSNYTKFRLYTRRNRYMYDILKPFDADTVTSSHFIGDKNTVFIIHGFNDSPASLWMTSMVKALLKKEDMNVIIVNWSRGADGINYYQAAANTRVVGALLAKMMEQLHNSSGISYSQMHLIGHSLGAHIAGYAGNRIPGTGRITGLDPAAQSFEGYDIRVRLDPTDALYVDVIHTDGDGTGLMAYIKSGFGYDKALGDADFYPNGGEFQPGCTWYYTTDIFNALIADFKGLRDSIACSHRRALDLFIESINSPCTFKAYPCTNKRYFHDGHCHECEGNCAVMGYNSDINTRGIFYLKTNAATPFCKH